MGKYLSMLRGINVSGQKLIKMEELRKSYEKLGLSNVKSYIQSGNVIFEAEGMNEEQLSGLISDAIRKEFSFDVPVIVLQENELARILKKNPFVKKAADEKSLYVCILESVAPKKKAEELKIESGDDEYAIVGRAVYLYYPNLGAGNSKLSNNLFEKKLGLTATTRNWRTLNILLGMLKGEE
jgi:uncharacterized protein (DUF1697 family)